MKSIFQRVMLLIMLIFPSQVFASPVVLELFTSQGCSSCPPADRLLAELDSNPEVIALSMHVNYWDYIGWKDPFSLDITTQRQQDYSHTMKRNEVFTPQMIINGQYSVVGSDAAAIQKILNQEKQKNQLVDMQVEGKILYLPVSKEKMNAIVEQISYLPTAVTKVLRGENAGNDLTSINIVTSITTIGKWDGTEKSISIAETKGNSKSVLLLRDQDNLHVIGALKL